MNTKTSEVIHKVWLIICRIFCALYFTVRLYKIWSNVYRLIFERKYLNGQLSTFATLSEVASHTARKFKYRYDGPKELFDAVSAPQRLEVDFTGDCDDVAIWVTSVIQRSLLLGLMKSDNVARAYFFTVCWMEPDNRVGGHNVCLLEYKDGKMSYMDYGWPSKKVDTIQEVADLVRSRYAGYNTTGHGTKPFEGIMFAVQDEYLNPLLIVRK